MKVLLRKNIFVFILISSLILISCRKRCIEGEGAITSKVLSVAEFKGVSFEGAANIFISQGETQELKVVGHPNIIDRIETNISGDICYIQLEDGCYKTYDLEIYVTMPSVQLARLIGSGDVTINNFDENKYETLSVYLEGTGEVTFKKITGLKNLTVELNGSGNIDCEDSVTNVEFVSVDIEGSGNYNGFPVETQKCKVNIIGSGNCNVNVKNELDVSIEGSGKVYYKGNPTIKTNIEGSGEVVDFN